MAKTILIIDDDKDIQNIYGQKLSSVGYNVLVSTSGEQGIYTAREEKPDLILLDVMFPSGMNGFEVLEEIKNDDNLKDTPIIMLTNLDSEKKVAKTIGVKNYLIKANIELNELVKIVKKYC